MRTLIMTLIAASLLLVSCQSHEKQNKLYEEGISLELAQLRKQEIKNLKYNLSFSIPEKKEDPVNGEAHIRFNLQHPQEIILDFRESADKIKEVSVNGKTSTYIFRNEHLILPEAFSIQGENDVYIRFTAGNQSLNRNDEYLYTLLVPCRAHDGEILTGILEVAGIDGHGLGPADVEDQHGQKAEEVKVLDGVEGDAP